MSESPETRLKRLKLRSIRRGIREMDLLLAAFAADHLARLSPAELDAYEALLDENDHDLLAWVTGSAETPAEHARMISKISADARASAHPERFERF